MIKLGSCYRLHFFWHLHRVGLTGRKLACQLYIYVRLRDEGVPVKLPETSSQLLPLFPLGDASLVNLQELNLLANFP